MLAGSRGSKLLSGHSVSSRCTGSQLVGQVILGLDRSALLGIVAQTLESSALTAVPALQQLHYKPKRMNILLY